MFRLWIVVDVAHLVAIYDPYLRHGPSQLNNRFRDLTPPRAGQDSQYFSN